MRQSEIFFRKVKIFLNVIDFLCIFLKIFAVGNTLFVSYTKFKLKLDFQLYDL